jgi:hypothetical protein
MSASAILIAIAQLVIKIISDHVFNSNRRQQLQLKQATAPSTTINLEKWMKTNHSKATIDYVKVHSDHTASEIRSHDIKEIVKRYYRTHIGRFLRIRIIDEDSGTLNFRIVNYERKSILLRIHKRITNEDTINTLQHIQRYIFESEIFADSQFDKCLIPLPSISGRTFEHFKNKFVEVYPFAEKVTHYSGQNMDQVKSFAYKYGCVQKTLQKLDLNSDPDGMIRSRPYINWFRGDAELFDLICESNKRAIKEKSDDVFTAFFNRHQGFLRSIWNEVRPMLENIKDQGKPLLHDLHPHNTFFKNDKCVLIYDYEAVSLFWPAYSGRRLPLIPVEPCHRFQSKLATDSD